MGIWNVVWCDVECITMLPNHALTHHTTTYCTSQPHISTLHHTTAAYFLNIPHLLMLHSTDHALPHRTTMYCTSCDVMRCGVMVHEMECGVVRCGMGRYTLHMLCHITPPHTAHHCCTILWHSHITCRIMCNMWWCMVWNVM